MRLLTVLDGGMGHQLKAMGVVIEGAVGAQERFKLVARACLDQPALVTAAHQTFIDAGAQVITTNNYACVPNTVDILRKDDESADSPPVSPITLSEMVIAAGECAKAAVNASASAKGTSALIAGSIPPLGPSYKFELVPSEGELAATYGEIITAIAPFSDMLLIETMSCVRESVAAAKAAKGAEGAGLPVWLSVTLDEERLGCLRSGETIEELVESVAQYRLEAILLNCTSPEAVTATMPRLREAATAEVRIGAYANGFVTAASGAGEYDDTLTPEKYAECAAKWVEDGASIVGGCCGIMPNHIEALAGWAATAEL